MVKASSSGTTAPVMSVNFVTTIYVERASTLGVMSGITLVNGSQTRCMVPEFSGGLMVVYTRANLSTIEKRDKESSLGPMDACMKVHGLVASRMALVISQMSKALRQRVNGQKARSNAGSTIEMNEYRLTQQQNNLLFCFRHQLVQTIINHENEILDLLT